MIRRLLTIARFAHSASSAVPASGHRIHAVKSLLRDLSVEGRLVQGAHVGNKHRTGRANNSHQLERKQFSQPSYQLRSVKSYFPEYLLNGRSIKNEFVDYYCKRFSLQKPEEVSEHISKRTNGKKNSKSKASRRTFEDDKWHVKYATPQHTITLSSGNEQIIPAINCTFVARSLAEARNRAQDLMVQHLLAALDQSVINDFIYYATPIRRKIADMLEAPVVVELPKEVVEDANSLFEEFRSGGIFELRKEKAKPSLETDDSFRSEGDTHRLRHHTSSVKMLPYAQVTASTIQTPEELDGSKGLPMYAYYSRLMEAIENNSVTIVAASTGAGKTTQLPQFILAYYKAQKKSKMSAAGPLVPPNVIVTQPRRIAAISVAQRVAKERGEIIGRNSAIGYTVRFQSLLPRKSLDEEGHVIFCTSGILLRMLNDNPNLVGVTHIILDEVHERDLNTDLLLIIVRELVNRRPELKVILMSATADTALFANYFTPKQKQNKHLRWNRSPLLPPPLSPPVVTVPGRLYPVKEFYLNDVLDFANKVKPLNKMHPQTRAYVQSELRFEPMRGRNPFLGSSSTSPLDNSPTDLFEAIIAYIVQYRGPGAILVFLPGWSEISSLMQKLKDDNLRVGFGDKSKFRLYALHSSVSSAGQEEVFERPPEGVRKIILATNIAETSVTINDVVFVVDSAKIRINTYDSNARISALKCVVASKSNLKQRSGRAGRCQPGEYYSVITERHHSTLPYSIPPELLRVDLQSTLLKVKALNLAPFVADVIALAPEPPLTEAVTKALSDLKLLGALQIINTKSDNNNKPANWDENIYEREVLTPLGEALCNLPVDPWLGKLLIQAAAYRVLNPILSVANILEGGGGIFAIHPDEREAARLHFLKNFVCGREEGMGSDLLASVVAYNDWKKSQNRRQFANENYLNFSALMNVERGREQILSVLKESGINGIPELNENGSNMELVRSLLCGALFPNIAEARDRNVYATPTDGKMRVSGSTVNSFSNYSLAKNYQLNPAVGMAILQQSKSEISSSPADSDADTLESEDDDGGETQAIFQVPVLPPRFLSYQEKQMVEGAVWMRNTTVANPLGVLLFGSFGNEGARLSWLNSSNELSDPSISQQSTALLGGWMRISFPNKADKLVVEETRMWMDKYLQWMVSSRRHESWNDTDHAKQADCGRRLARLISRILSS